MPHYLYTPIKDYFIPPHPSLSSYIDNYILSTSENEIISFKNYWPASNETSIVFNLLGLPDHDGNAYNNSSMANMPQCVIGLLTRHNGLVHFKGIYSTFIIQFKANGFSKLFRMPVKELINQIVSTEGIFGNQAKGLYEQLLNATDIQQMACFADRFLLSFLSQHKKTDTAHDGITAVSRELYNTTELLSVSQYAYKANMSVRNFERRFTEQTGVSPKFYIRLVRFNEALKRKIIHPAKNWISIAHECGYYDQMHLIKDFKQFAALNPTKFFCHDPDLVSSGTEVITHSSTFEQFNKNVPDQKNIFVRRVQF